MPTGVTIDCIAVLLGALLGSFLGSRMPQKLQMDLNVLLGFCAMAIGINSLMKAAAMTPVIVAILLGYILGSGIRLETRITVLFSGILARVPLPQGKEFSMERYITAVVLFCASGFGIYSTFVEAMSGNSAILLSKAVLDFFTAMIFASSLSYCVALIPIPMALVLMGMFGLGKCIAPWMTEEMLRDFTACGGIMTIAAGLRVSGIKATCIADLIPALVLVMPLSFLWRLLGL